MFVISEQHSLTFYIWLPGFLIIIYLVVHVIYSLVDNKQNRTECMLEYLYYVLIVNATLHHIYVMYLFHYACNDPYPAGSESD